MPFVEMRAPRESRDSLAPHVADHSISCGSNDGGHRPVRDLRVRENDGVAQGVGKITEAGTKNNRNRGWCETSAADELGRGLDQLELVPRVGHRSMPAMVAVRKFANVPAIMA